MNLLKAHFFLFIFCLVSNFSFGIVIITPAQGGKNTCASNSLSGTTPTCTTLDTIAISESLPGDFSIGLDTITLHSPLGWHFCTSSIITNTYSGNITLVSIGGLTDSTLTLIITVSGIDVFDTLSISGILIQALNDSAAAGSIYASSVFGINGISVDTSIFGNLSITPVITGLNNVCDGQTITLNDSVSGGTWSSNNTTIATISSSGIITGNAVGSVIISYTTGIGCIVTKSITVNSLPATITGINSVCEGFTTTLNESVSGGAWSISNPTKAIITGTGVVLGIAAGTDTVSYTTVSGCIATYPISINPNPANITGVKSLCHNSTTTLSDINLGGSWVSNNTYVATITGTGIVSGLLAGNATISYTLPTGCSITTVVTVNPLPDTITGTNSVCIGSTTTLSETSIGGNWISGNTSVATISGIGILSGISVGQATISYTLPTGCVISTIITVNPLPAAITGSNSVCEGATGTLTETTTGIWSVSNSSNAIVTGTGVILGILAGADTVSFSESSTGCITSLPITVNPVPNAIAGTTTVCSGNSVSLSDATVGGSWSSSNALIVTVTSSGVATGAFSGSAFILYTLPTGCSTFTSFNVEPLPAPITGVSSICESLITTLSETSTGGNWSFSNTTIATVTNTGIVNGILAGTDTISYSFGTGCSTSFAFTVNPLPAAINLSSLLLCVGSSTLLTDVTLGGNWFSNDTLIASISNTGSVIGNSAGNTIITYSLPTGCVSTTSISVNPTPLPISGINTVCVGFSSTLNETSTGGNWTSSNTAIATIDNTGIVNGLLAGIDTITYSFSSGCFTTFVVTINPLPAIITGTSLICSGTSTNLSDATLSGSWLSQDTLVATVSNSGTVNGISGGNAVIVYTLPTGCNTSTIISVNPIPASITGSNAVCEGQTSTLSETSTGGTWSISNSTVALITGSGVVLGVAPGIEMVSYSIGSGCYTVFNLTVNPAPSSIIGANQVCTGSSIILSNSISGGNWVSSNTSVATISSIGVLTGISPGTIEITYSTAGGCNISTFITVNPIPVTILGTSTVCQGLTIILTETTLGGMWSISNTTYATVSGSGIVSGNLVGVDTIIYSLPTGCNTFFPITVSATPTSITGTTFVCSGSSTTLSNVTIGGTWVSSDTTIATISDIGVVTGLTSGFINISYTLNPGCQALTSYTVNPLPAPIVGNNSTCIGSTIVFIDSTVSGIWSSSNTLIGTIDLLGNFNGINIGVDTVSYTLISTGCTTTLTLIINPTLSPILGIPIVCSGSSTTLSDAISGGNWSSLNTLVAMVTETGIVTGNIADTTTITYMVSPGCFTTINFNVNPNPTPITGLTNICAGFSTPLADATPFGTWVSNSPTIASITGIGVVNASLVGLDTIVYYLESGCFSSLPITINPMPAPISGISLLCAGSSTTLSDLVSGGSWSTDNSAIADISNTGVVTGFSSGLVTISYTLDGGCFVEKTITINASPSIIYGDDNLCEGNRTTYIDTVSGGIWTSDNSSVAIIDSFNGILTAIHFGTSTITYTISTGCFVTKTITINQIPPVIIGISTICVNDTSLLIDSLTGGTWLNTGSNLTISSTGLVTGISSGLSTISYIMPTGCYTLKSITVNPLAIPGIINGGDSVCLLSSIILTDTTSGDVGIWLSSDTIIAQITSATGISGIVTGISTGIFTISYAVTNSCGTMFTTKSIYVNSIPNAGLILGLDSVCLGASITLTDSVFGGTWSGISGNTLVVDNTITGISLGLDTISYTVSNTCGSNIVSKIITILGLQDAGTISGGDSVCVGGYLSLTNTVTGGIWASSNTNASVFWGIVTGLNSGTDTIFYNVLNYCGINSSTYAITVNPLPDAGFITGIDSICIGGFTTFSASVPYGVWSTNNISASIDTNGIITGISAGIDTINYMVNSIACGSVSATKTINIIPFADPGIITGLNSVCVGSNIIIADTTSFGLWQVSNTNAVLSNDTLTGVLAGLDTISYSVTNYCGTVATSVIITMNSLPVAGIISGSDTVCISGNITLTASAPLGIWSSSNTSAFVIGGLVTGVSAGIDTISYTENTLSCGSASTSKIIAIMPMPNAGVIIGLPNICVGATIVLTDTTQGGTWLASNTNATVSTDSVKGILPGADTIIYSVTNYCGTALATHTVFVIAMPDAGIISGLDSVCVGANIGLSESVSGGTWNVTNTKANVSSGIVSGITSGKDTIIYTFNNYCGTATTSKSIFIKPLPNAGTIIGSDTICLGTSTTLLETSILGYWSATNSSATISPISPGGLLTPVSLGNDTIIYSVNNTCGTAKDSLFVTISSIPPIPFFSGSNYVCVGGKLDTLICTPTGGIWSSSNSSIVMIIGDTAIGVTPGRAAITYSIINHCGTTFISDSISVFTKSHCDSMDTINYVYPLNDINSLTLVVYPNPSNGMFIVMLPDMQGRNTISIFDIYGKIISSVDINSSDNDKIPFELSYLPKGNYFIKVTNKEKTYRQKIEIW